MLPSDLLVGEWCLVYKCAHTNTVEEEEGKNRKEIKKREETVNFG